GGSHERVVAARGKLDQAEAVAERVSKRRDAPEGDGLWALLDACAGARRACGCGVEILHDHVSMNRRPVTLVGARLAAGADGPRRLAQEIEPHRPPEDFHDIRSEAAADFQAEGLHVEAFGLREIGHIYVEKYHRMTGAGEAARTRV